jgi:hypothetical protein
MWSTLMVTSSVSLIDADDRNVLREGAVAKPERFNETAIDLIIILAGASIVLLGGYFNSDLVKGSFQAIGTALVAAGLSAFLIWRFHSKTTDDEQRVSIISGNRIDLESEYVRRKYVARELDIVSIALAGALEEMANDSTERILKRVLFDRVKIRLMFLSPSAGYVTQRATEDGVSISDLENELRRSVEYCASIYRRLEGLFREASTSRTFRRERMGALEIRLMDMCPHYTIYRSDEEILWGIYTSAQRGYFSSVLLVTKKHKELHEQLVSHFDSMWDKSRGDGHYLVRFYGPAAPQVNESLLTQILGRGWQNSYLASSS